MSVWSLIFPIATVILSALCYVCYKTNKPLREKAKAEAKAKELEELKKVQEAFVKEQREDFRKKVFSDMEQVITTPDILIDYRYGSQIRGNGYRWKRLAEFIFKVEGLKDQSETISNLSARIQKQSELIRDLQKDQKDIMKALQMGHPVEL